MVESFSENDTLIVIIAPLTKLVSLASEKEINNKKIVFHRQIRLICFCSVNAPGVAALHFKSRSFRRHSAKLWSDTRPLPKSKSDSIGV